jgi:LAO/AO transport system kinase
MIHLFDAAGFDLILVETVGVGQEEIDVARLVDTVVLVQVPGSGDGVQLLKAGLLEYADVFVVNKADLPGTEELLRGLRSMVVFSSRQGRDWVPPVLRCAATEGTGVAGLADAITAHFAHLYEDDRLHRRRRAIATAEIVDHVNAAILRRLGETGDWSAQVEPLVDEVAGRRLVPLKAAHQILERWGDDRPGKTYQD